MRLLLDTHSALWWWANDDRLSERARALIGDPDNAIAISAASIWEMTTKNRLGKLGPLSGVATLYATLIARHRFDDLPISIAHAGRAGTYAQSHKDPFDRLLAAQSELEGMAIITRDRELSDFPCETVW